jgi:polysaccharide export outer membrane protein
MLQLEKKITSILEKDYLFHPIVNVTIHQYRSKVVNILGNVNNPGKYYLQKPTKLFDLIADVNIKSPHSGNIISGQMAQILRNTEHKSEKEKCESISIDLYELLVNGKEELNIYLQNGDIIYIYIPEVKSVHIIGEVKKPGSFAYERGITVLKAISLAGGPTKNASVDNSSVKRIRNNEQVEISVKMSDLLEPGDVVVVPLSFW